jgi:hypothetical protein
MAINTLNNLEREYCNGPVSPTNEKPKRNPQTYSKRHSGEENLQWQNTEPIMNDDKLHSLSGI